MYINIQTVPASKQRYPTCGDWIFNGPNAITIYVSAQEDWRYEFLIGLHELIEAALCKSRDIPQAAVDNFDIGYEAARSPKDLSEPGNHPNAPYREEHRFATRIEKLVARELGVNFTQYDATLSTEKKK